MESSKYTTNPRLIKLLEDLGMDIKLARLRRKWSAGQVAERAGISRSTLWQVEKGMPHVSIGRYMQVLLVLGLERTLSGIASDDEMGRKLQDAALLQKRRAPKKLSDECK